MPAPMRKFWSAELDDDPRGAAAALVDRNARIEQASANVLARNIALTSARLYENQPISSLYMFAAHAGGGGSGGAYLGERSADNVLRAAVHAAQAIITRNRTRPAFLTRGGDWLTRDAVEKLNKIVDAIFSHNDTYNLAGGVIFIDAAVPGLGLIHVYHDGQSVIHERCWPTDLCVDPVEAKMGWDYVLTFGIRRRLDREVAMERYGDTPERKQAIEMAPRDKTFGEDSDADLICVDQGWHKRVGKVDGRFSVAIRGMELHRAKWPHAWVPLVPYVWEPGLLGIWGRSIAEQATLPQVVINTCNARKDRALSIASVPRLIYTGPNKFPTSKLDNKIGLVIQLQPGEKLEDFAWQANTEPFDREIAYQKSVVFANQGLNEGQAQGASQLGDDASGEAQRVEVQIASNRLAPHQSRWDRMFVNLGRTSALVARQLHKEKGRGKVSFALPQKGYAELIDSAALEDLEEESFIVDCAETNKLPTDPAGLIATAINLVKAEIWTPEEGADAIRTLDNEEPETLTFASREHLQQVFDEMIREGKYIPPDELDDLQRGIVMAARYALRALTRKVPMDRVEHLRTWIEDATAELRRRAAKMAADAPPAPAAPPMPPGAPDGAAQGPPGPDAGAMDQ